jgi:hypothetical protein
MRVVVVALVMLCGCTVILGNHNAAERNGPCQINWLGACRSDGATSGIDTKKDSTEGERSSSLGVEVGGEVGTTKGDSEK